MKVSLRRFLLLLPVLGLIVSHHAFAQCTPPTILSKKDSNRCGPGTVVLEGTVSAGGILKWYANATGGAVLGTGNSFTTPSLTTTTTYYVAAASTGSGPSGTMGIITPPATSFTAGFGTGASYSLSFDAISAFTLNSVDIYPYATSSTAGTVTIGLLNSANVTLQQATFNVTGTPQSATALTPYTANLNFAIPVGTGYKLVVLSYTGISASMFNTFVGSSPYTPYAYPYTLAGVASITNANWPSGSTPNLYYYFYNWVIGTNCESARQAVTATVKTMPTVNIGNDTTICPGISYTFNAGNPGASYAWNTGATTQSITVNAAGTYSVLVTAANGCANSDAINVTQGVAPVNNLPAITNLCAGETAALNAGNTGSTFLWTPGNATTQFHNVTTAGTYSVRVRSIHGCVINSSTNVIIRPLPVPALGNDTSICEGAQITLNAGNPGYSYLWNTSATTQTVQASDSGMYTVTITSPYNCVLTDNQHVAYLPSPRVEGFNFIPLFYENLGKVKFSPLNPTHVNSYEWDFGDGSPTSTQVNPTHVYSIAGDYEVSLKVYNDCGDYMVKLPINVDLTTGIVTLGKDAANVMLYPNPSREYITIDNKSSDIRMEQIMVFNMLGAVVYHETDIRPDKHQLQVNRLAAGIYTARILTNKGFVIRKFEVIR